MFLGHFAAGMAAKRALPQTSLAILFAAAQLADMIWPVLVWAGVERVRIEPGNTPLTRLDFSSYPWSHSLLLLTAWAVAFAVVYAVATGKRRAVFVLVALVLSHWVLDFVTHRPDMPLYPGSAKVGLGVWNSVAATIVLELVLFAAGVRVYVGATRARDGVGRWAFAGLVSLLLLIYIGNVFGPPPPSVSAIVASGTLGSGLLMAWAWWADRHRVPSVGPA